MADNKKSIREKTISTLIDFGVGLILLIIGKIID